MLAGWICMMQLACDLVVLGNEKKNAVETNPGQHHDQRYDNQPGVANRTTIHKKRTWGIWLKPDEC
jgi:hypothetical protein